MIQTDIMKRIKITTFSKLPFEDQLNRIVALQKLREQSLAESRIKKGRQTKSAKKNLAKRGKKVQDPAKDLLKLIKKMPPKERLAFLTEMKGD